MISCQWEENEYVEWYEVSNTGLVLKPEEGFEEVRLGHLGENDIITYIANNLRYVTIEVMGFRTFENKTYPSIHVAIEQEKTKTIRTGILIGCLALTEHNAILPALRTNHTPVIMKDSQPTQLPHPLQIIHAPLLLSRAA